VYVVDFNPRVKAKPGKLRPVLVVQSNLVNEAGYPSTIVIPTTRNSWKTPAFYDSAFDKRDMALDCDSDLLLGQLIAVANESFRKEIGSLQGSLIEEVERRVRIIFGL
jgi:mRNA interferase MazF